jgi:Fe-S-cluster containining protein
MSDALPAGEFGAWERAFRRALDEGGTSDVPCAGCTACCRSSQFVHVDPDEIDTLAHIPSELLVPAPNLPRGHMVMGYDERGHCPMLGDDGCSIYEHRPRTCRTYDCRVFAATGVEPASDAIAERVSRWEFSYANSDARARHNALRQTRDLAAFMPRERRNPTTSR